MCWQGNVWGRFSCCLRFRFRSKSACKLWWSFAIDWSLTSSLFWDIFHKLSCCMVPRFRVVVHVLKMQLLTTRPINLYLYSWTHPCGVRIFRDIFLLSFSLFSFFLFSSLIRCVALPPMLRTERSPQWKFFHNSTWNTKKMKSRVGNTFFRCCHPALYKSTTHLDASSFSDL